MFGMKTWILIWCILQRSCTTYTQYVNICSNAMQDKSLSCSSNREIIRIDRVFTAYIANATTCDETFQGGGVPRNPPAECRAWQTEAYYRCHGKRSCTVYPWWADTNVPSCEESQRTNFLQIQFSCRMQPTSVWLPMYRNLTGPVMDIFSPGFPYGTPRGPYSFSCSITPADDSNQPIEIMIRRNIKFERTPSTEYCIEKLYYEYGPVIVLCSGAWSYYEFNREDRYSFVNMFRFTYSTKRDTPGGYFLLEIRGFKNSVPINLKIDCPDLTSILPLPSSSSSSSSTSSTTTTRTSTIERTATDSTTATSTSNGTGDRPEKTSVNILTETTAEPILMTSSKDTVLYGVIGALTGTIIIMVIVFLLMKWRKNIGTTNRISVDNSAPETTSPTTGHLNSVYTDLTTVTDNSKQIYAKLHEANHGRLGEENQDYVNVRENTEVSEDTEEDTENGYADIE